ncbi:hypothetical protein [Methylomonas koyamae]|nr:hypothetical protein [Methylomonas koyamae]
MTDNIDISISKDEYRLLLEFLLLADKCVLSAERKNFKSTAPYRALIEKLLRYAEPFQCADLVVDIPGLPHRMVSDSLESKLIYKTFSESLDEDQFWLKLAHALAVRDVDAELGLTRTQPKNPTEQAEFDEIRLFKLADKHVEWRNELLRNGLSRFELRSPTAFDVLSPKGKSDIN